MSSYNHAPYVVQAIESVINQTYHNIEFFVIDDGSTDESPRILNELQKKYGFYLECRTNHGLVPTLNYILQNLVTGEYVCGISSDDFWEYGKIEKQVALLNKHPECGFCHSSMYLIDKNNQISLPTKTKIRKEGNLFEELLRGKINIGAPSVMIPFFIYKEMNFYNESIPIEDYQFWLKVLSKYPVCYIDEPLVYYRTHGFNMSQNSTKMLEAEQLVIKEWEHHPSFLQAKADIYLRWFSEYAKLDKKKALQCLIAVMDNPKIIFHRNFYKGMKRVLFYWK